MSAVYVCDSEALRHPYWSEFPMPKDKSEMPTYPSTAEGAARYACLSLRFPYLFQLNVRVMIL